MVLQAVLIHGHEITNHFSKEQFKTVSVDLIGHGQSAVPNEVLSVFDGGTTA